jgi:hypothetical protein
MGHAAAKPGLEAPRSRYRLIDRILTVVNSDGSCTGGLWTGVVLRLQQLASVTTACNSDGNEVRVNGGDGDNDCSGGDADDRDDGWDAKQ